ncbi:MAG: hypothetical protein HOY71_11240, partial [Nonomuraea sp.]|nr:hypothetical protein [Nonomuraea sp.]
MTVTDERSFHETGLVALDLANTWDPWLDDPERLPSVEALRGFCAEFGEDPGALDLAAVRAVRSRLRVVLALEPERRGGALGEWLAELPARPAVVEAGGVPSLGL